MSWEEYKSLRDDAIDKYQEYYSASVDYDSSLTDKNKTQEDSDKLYRKMIDLRNISDEAKKALDHYNANRH